MKPIFEDEAEAELAEARNWYNEKDAGLGDRFVAAVEAAVTELMRDPTSWPVIENEIRRKPVQSFPYDVLFAAGDDEVVIVAVMNLKRRPGYWKDRLD